LVQFSVADRAFAAHEIFQYRLAFVIFNKANVQVKRTTHHHIATFQPDHRRAARCRLYMPTVHVNRAQPLGRNNRQHCWYRQQKTNLFYDTALWVFWLSRVIDRKFHDRKQAQNFHK